MLVIFVIRTRRSPLRNRPNRLLAATSVGVVAIAMLLPFTPVGGSLGFVPPPPVFFLILAGMTLVYLLAVEGVKRWFYRSRLSQGLPRPPQNILLGADR